MQEYTGLVGAYGVPGEGGTLSARRRSLRSFAASQLTIFDSTFTVRYSEDVAMGEKYDENMSDRYENEGYVKRGD